MASDAVDNEQGVLGAEEALTFLDEASALLAGSLDYEQTLGHVAQLTVPLLADWCAVDIVESDGSLRQITSGHPDPEQEQLLADLRYRYRQQKGASEGVRRVIDTGEPELMGDVRGAQRARLEILAEEAALYERLGPRSYLIVPLVARGRTIGALTLLSTVEGRHYGEPDLAFAQRLAQRFALAVDNARLYGEAEASRAGLDDFFTSAPVGLAFLDTDARYVRVNPALAELNGRSVEEHLGRTPGELLGEAGAAAEQLLRGVIASGEPIRDLEASGPRPGGEGEIGHWLVSFTPIRAAGGAITGASAVVMDVTDRRRALDAERDAARRAQFMVEAGAVLDASMDYEEVLEELAQLAVPGLADWCFVSVLDDDGDLCQVAVAHADPDRREWAIESARRHPPVVDARGGVGKVVATGETEVVNEVGDELLVAIARDAEHLANLRAMGMTAGVTAPLVARGRTLGALSFVTTDSGRRYEEADVQLLTELGRRAGIAVENARLYTERSRIAHTLQARLLPTRLPAPPGVRLAARYRAAGQFNEVGGDFYDAFQRAPDEWAVVIGDVSGKGPEAAALTAMARYTIRAAALNDWSPAHVLRRLNDTLLREEESQFVTVALAYVSHADGGIRVKLVLGGHPPPFVVRAGGGAEAVGEPGTLLGIGTNVRLTQVDLTLAPGDALLLYTDGVIESGPRDAPFGEDGLHALLAGLGEADPEALVAAVDAAARDADHGRARDDVAIVALQAAAVAPRPAPLEIERPADAVFLHELREAVVRFAAGIGGLDVEAVRLAVGEACANVVVHAYRRSPEPGAIRVRALEQDGRLVVEVRDDGCGPAPRSDSPGMGLGLPLMTRLATELQVLDREPSGTLVRLTFAR